MAQKKLKAITRIGYSSFKDRRQRVCWYTPEGVVEPLKTLETCTGDESKANLKNNGTHAKAMMQEKAQMSSYIIAESPSNI